MDPVDDREHGLIDEAVATLRDKGARLVYLFGSRATGTARSDSDIDMAAWFGRDDIDSLEARGALPERVDVVVLDRAPLALRGRVALQGTLLYEADPAERVRWESTTRVLYFDERPYRDEAWQDFVATLDDGRR